jgi:cytochrome P450 PksS
MNKETLKRFYGEFEDRYSIYELLRKEGPVIHDEVNNSWIVIGFEQVRSLMNTEVLSSVRKKLTRLSEEQKVKYADLREFYSKWLMYQDSPDHDKAKTFAMRFLKGYNRKANTDNVETNVIVETLRNQTGEFDFVEVYSKPMAALLISDLFRIKYPQMLDLLVTSEHVVNLINIDHPSDDFLELVQGRLKEFYATFKDLVDFEKLQSDNSEIELLEADLFIILANIFMDGYKSIQALISLVAFNLISNLSVGKTRDLSVMSTEWVEELLRYDPPFQYVSRVAQEDFQFEGHSIRKGDKVFLVLAAGNRDEREYKDSNSLSIRDNSKHHLSFGYGKHYCIGAGIVRDHLPHFFNPILSLLKSMKIIKVGWEQSIGYRSLTHLILKNIN